MELRNKNLARFVYLKRPLRHFMPPASNMWDKEIARGEAIDALIRTIKGHSAYYENDDLRIYPKMQKELWEEGFDKIQTKYVGAKWGIFIRAPEIFFKVLPKIKKKLIPLSSLGQINEGKPTGAEEFFYPTKDIAEKYRIEKEFLKPAILKPRGKNVFELKKADIDTFFLTVRKSREELKGSMYLITSNTVKKDIFTHPKHLWVRIFGMNLVIEVPPV